MSNWGWVLGGMASATFFYLFIRGSKMVDVNALQAEVEKELRDEESKVAKNALKNVERDIINAKKLVANLERKKADIIVAIGEGSL